jgi:serine/threonine protein kinase
MTRPETSLKDPIGEQFGPYKLVRRLGIGGMAETFEAIRSGPSGFEQRVCLKLVLPFFRQDENFIELFHREAKLAAKLRHSNIVGVIDFGEVDGTPYMALELVDGCDLRRLLDTQDRTRLSPEYVALIGLDLAAGLEHAHNPGEELAVDESSPHLGCIVHRDISPSNVLISRHGEILLTDFGVAKAITATARKQSTVKGKIPYMSTEQLSGEFVDGRSDLFALGVVLFEALAGQRPYEGPNDPATILLTLKGEHPSLRTLVPNAPAKLCEIIESLLEPDVTRRPQTAAALIELLDEFTPSQRTRRELGELVTRTPELVEALASDMASAVEKSAGQTKRRLPDPEGLTAPASDSAASQESKPEASEQPRPKSRRKAMWGLAGLALAIGGLAAAGILWPSPDGQDGSAGSDTAVELENVDAATETPRPPPPEEETAAETEAEAVETPRPEAPSKAQALPKATPVAAAPARLTVIVIPWGNVWIDGKPAGISPLKNKSLKPGRYKVSAGQGSPSKSQTIRLRPGQRQTVQFDLIE